MRLAAMLALCLAGAPDAGPAALTPDAIKDVVHEHRAEARACYDPVAARKPGLAGKVVVRFVIGLDGKVSSASVASTTLNEPQVETCLVNAARGWRFLRPKHGTVEVNFPFQLGPPGSAKPALPRAKPVTDKAPDESEPDVLR